MNPRRVFFFTAILGLGLAAVPSVMAYLGFGNIEHRLASVMTSVIVISVLVAYHFWAARFMRMRPEASSVADSCYYLGFIFTLGILCLTFLLAEPNEATAITSITTQFALGLVSTGYGLIARIHLGSFNDTEAFEDAFSRQEQLAARLTKLSSVIEQSTSKTQILFERQSEHLSNSISTAQANMAKELASIAELASQFARKIADLSSVFIPDQEAEALKKSLAKFVKIVDEGRSEMDALAGTFRDVNQEAMRTASIGQDLQQVTATLDAMKSAVSACVQQMESFDQQIRSLSDKSRIMADSMDQRPFEQVANVMTEVNGGAQRLTDSLTALEDKLNDMVVTTSSLSSAQKVTASKLESILPELKRTGNE